MFQFSYDELEKVILKIAQKRNISITKEQIELFFASEEEYMRSIGLIPSE
ncbi:hypothetical protein ABES28_08505 [Bacillus licheniformis]|uniref:Uncharacterized protein n=1 Tax=Bacillus licheniformis TaxID=1402 RepID=A0AB37GLU5_BACLI|nr:hypothetical protein [Bacillus licheniformis]QPR71071.1 hypothetical protein I6G80_14580 [Bacillus licheniformis]